MKAMVGDYLLTSVAPGDKRPLKIVALEGRFSDPCLRYVLEDGSRIADADVSYRDVRLPSQVAKFAPTT